MTSRHAQRYCADPEALAAMKRDGLGWGHDMDCGCFHDVPQNTKIGGLSRLINTLKRRT